jgi:outer membrane lipoprotein SlyB
LSVEITQENLMQTTPSQARTHPLILTAAIAVTAVALAGVGVLTGVLPNPAAAPRPETPITQPQIQPQELATEKTAELADPIKIADSTESVKPEQTKSAAPAHKHVTKKARTAVSPAPTSEPISPAKCHDCGVVEQIRTLTIEPDGSGVGGVAGGVVGGLLGNQIGQGRGRTVATVVGVVGGALAGNKIEKTMKKKQTYETVVRYEDGTTQVFPSETPPGWREGDKVRLNNGTLISR